MAKADIRGETFGRLYALRRVSVEGRKDIKSGWYCLCKCGGRMLASTSALRSGNTQSCGCLKKRRGPARRTDDTRSVIQGMQDTEEALEYREALDDAGRVLGVKLISD